MNKQVTIVAVDGPSASGKSTVSRRTAQAVGFIYVDSGALYRGVTWKCVKAGIDVKDSQAVTNLLIRMLGVNTELHRYFKGSIKLCNRHLLNKRNRFFGIVHFASLNQFG